MKTVWDTCNRNEVMTFAKGYISWLNASKTEREAIFASEKLAISHGFKPLDSYESLKAGDKVYVINRGKNICAFVIGKESLVSGLNVLGAHIDSPRIDLKQRPLYETDGLCLLDTHYYGGIKKYQWVALPLAMHGVICKKDGSSVNVVFGENAYEPCLGISDLLPHLGKDQMKKDGASIIEGEDLNILCGSIPSKDKEKDAVKANILNLLKAKYDIEEEDFISAELEMVPSGPARDYGFDGSMILGYGHDDRVCGYTSLMAVLECEDPERTVCTILVDKEEVGSIGSTGMHSRFFENTIGELMEKAGYYSPLNVSRCLTNSKMLSSDVSAAFDPNYPSVNEVKNTAYLGKGLCFNKYTGSRGKSGCNDAYPEFIAKIRKAMDDHQVRFQTSEIGKVDQGGGGTIAYILGNLDMDVIDAGIPVQNMHAPYEVVSKADVYEAYRGYKAFISDLR